jgi:hypothetical protein
MGNQNTDIVYSNQLVTKKYVDEHKFGDINTDNFIEPSYTLSDKTKYYPFSVVSRGTKLGNIHIGQFIINQVYSGVSIFEGISHTDSDKNASFSNIIQLYKYAPIPLDLSFIDIVYEYRVGD